MYFCETTITQSQQEKREALTHTHTLARMHTCSNEAHSSTSSWVFFPSPVHYSCLLFLFASICHLCACGLLMCNDYYFLSFNLTHVQCVYGLAFFLFFLRMPFDCWPRSLAPLHSSLCFCAHFGRLYRMHRHHKVKAGDEIENRVVLLP